MKVVKIRLDPLDVLPPDNGRHDDNASTQTVTAQELLHTGTDLPVISRGGSIGFFKMPHFTGIELLEQVLRIRLCSGFNEHVTTDAVKAMGVNRLS